MKKKVFKTISLLVGLSIGLLLGELASRVFLFGIDAFSYRKMQSMTKLAFTGYLQPAKSNKVLYELKPNIQGVFKGRPLITNSYGLRDQEYTLTKSDNKIRGVVLGDSFTMGSGITLEDTYHYILEEELNKNEAGDIQFEIINFGTSGYNLLNYQGLMEHKINAFSPDFILIGFCAYNDYYLPRQSHYNGKFKAKSPKDTTNPFFKFYLLEIIKSQLGLVEMNRNHKVVIGKEETAFINDMFGQFAQKSQELNIPVFIHYLAYHPDQGNLPLIKQIANKHHLHFIDSFDQLDTDHPEKYTLNLLDSHPNQYANEIFANSILTFPAFRALIQRLQ
ncbi:MAG: hypothetical protein AAFO02_02490 [Bacteroidota bacterium]